MRVLLISANREQLPAPVVPLGLLLVAASTRSAHEVELLDLCFEEDPHAVLTTSIAKYVPDVIGLGIRNLHDNAYRAQAEILADYQSLVATIRKSTAAPLVLGGAGFSLRPHELLARLEADYGVIGEGERTFPWLLSELAQGHKPARLIDNGVLVSQGLRQWSTLDDLPLPARDLIDPRYRLLDGTENVQTKRGCAFRCAYCDYPDLEGQMVRLRDPERIADEVLSRSQVPGVTSLFFVDSVFNVPRRHALAVCHALSARGAPLPWVAYVSPVSLDEELVTAMAQAGCIGVEIGSDSGSEEGLRRLRKPFGQKEIRSAHHWLHAAGIADCHTFVVGAFGETAEDVKKTLDFVSELDPDVAVFIVFHEDREDLAPQVSPHRAAILSLLQREAADHPGWVVPELGLRLSHKLQRFLRQNSLRGPAWLHLAAVRRRRHSSVVSAEPR